MKKYKVEIPYEYIDGYLRYGHGETTLVANNIEEAKIKAKEIDKYDFDCIVDDYRINDTGDLRYDEMTVEEVV